ncbi:CD63 antigen [Eupeodes corollae]|uniref:CD63 antigen n=1 Tax=Eupeodes corollae TaxID=290404 RepID=UPI0024903851|nr:CD63 antigen [Eupeodes corollae]XP_055907663.1 CD63 antigen [Eupeodes corollae]
MSLLTGSANCIKYTLFGFNLVFVLTGIILIAVGIGVAAVFNDYEIFLVSNFFSIPTFLIVIGILIFIISFVGCWGALKENYCFILIFSVLLGIIFILEISAGISGYVLKGDAEKLIEKKLKETILNYDKDGYAGTTYLWDSIQRQYLCCGVDDYNDWKPVLNTTLPLSCCNLPDGTHGPFSCTYDVEDKNRHLFGCLTGFSDYISSHAVSLGAAGVIIGVIQFFGVLFACYIAREVKIRNGITGWY